MKCAVMGKNHLTSLDLESLFVDRGGGTCLDTQKAQECEDPANSFTAVCLSMW